MIKSADPIRIKRYPNRRFYDTSASKYVSLKEVEDLIRDGNTVEIVENQSGADITRSILTQIILDRQPEKMSLFPADMLHCIVRSNDVVAGFLRDYFQHSLTYLDYLQRHGTTSPEIATPMHWVKAWLDGMKPATREQTAEDDNAQSLTLKIEQLEERLKQLEAKGV